MLKTAIISLLTALPAMLFAQGLSTDNATVNVGQILYLTPSEATFTLKNSSNKAIRIVEVETGCGCTQAEYPTNSIAPGSEFKLTATYDAKQLGHFQRTIFVTDDSSENPLELTLQGNVVLQVENFSGEYPVTLGNLLADNDAIEYDDVNKGDRLIRELHIMNPSGQYVEPVVMHTPSYLRAEIIPARLAPKKGGIIRFTLDSRKLRSLGLNQTSIYLAANRGEKVSEEKAISVSAVLLPEKLPNDAPSRLNGPKLELSATKVDMRNFAGKAKKKAEIIVKNSGKSTLDISSLQLFTGGIEVTLSKRKLAPGEATKMKITGFAEQLKKVKTRPRILMITNDPSMQKVTIEIQRN